MSHYQEMIRAHGFKSIENKVFNPSDTLAIGNAEFLAPVTLPASQIIAPGQPAARVKPAQNYDQYENIKMYPDITPDSFPYKGGGLK